MKGRGKGVLCKNMQWDDSDAKIRSNLFFCLRAEGQRKLQLKRPNLDIQTQARKNRMQILENIFVISRIMAFGMFIFICLKQRNKGTLEQLHLDLFELAFRADCGKENINGFGICSQPTCPTKRLQKDLSAETRSPPDAFEYAIRREKKIDHSKALKTNSSEPKHINETRTNGLYSTTRERW